MATLQKLWRDQRGQDMTEYALIAGMLASLTLGIVPEMFSILAHIADIVAGVAKTATDLTTLK